MPLNNQAGLAAGGLLPDDFYEFIRFSAILGLIAALVLVSALVYKGLKMYYGPETARKYRWVVVIVDVIILLVFGFIYAVLF